MTRIYAGRVTLASAETARARASIHLTTDFTDRHGWIHQTDKALDWVSD